MVSSGSERVLTVRPKPELNTTERETIDEVDIEEWPAMDDFDPPASTSQTAMHNENIGEHHSGSPSSEIRGLMEKKLCKNLGHMP